jgi:hypothetical protein
VPDDWSKEFILDPLRAMPDVHARVKKFIFLSATLFAALAGARADLVMEQQSGITNITDHVVLKVHDDKMRMDQRDSDGYAFSVVVDLKTRDSLTLFPQGKMFLKRSGAEILRQMETERIATNGTNTMDNPPDKAVDTGRREQMDGYDTEIYQWSGARGLTETLWVAKDFPDYDAIKTELAKIDRFDASGPHKDAQPELSLLPGMVVKAEKAAGGHKFTITLVSAKVEPVDASLFEMPADYTPWKPPVVQMTNTGMTPTNGNPPTPP